MELKEILKDIVKLNEINTKYEISNLRYHLELGSKYVKSIILDNTKDINYIKEFFVENVADQLINGNWKKDYDNYYYLIVNNDYDEEYFSLSIMNY